MRPLDPRLLRYAHSTRWFIIAAILIGVITAILIIAQAKLLSGVIVDVTSHGADLDTVADAIIIILAIFMARGLLAYGSEVAAFRSAAKAKEQLRQATLAHVLNQGPSGPAGEDPAAVATLITRGIDALDGYFARYLPQLVLAVIVPIAILATVLGQDILSAIIIAVTLPLIPIFMILIGLYTKTQVDRQWKTLGVLSGHFLDLISGLPTLKIFGRAKAQVVAIQRIGDRYRSSTMGVLRVTFLSSLALELLASLSVALVAVSVGLRLAEQQMTYGVALFVLLLAPEAYLPLRLVGQHFHAAAEGLGAADRMFTMLEQEPAVASGNRKASQPQEIIAAGVQVGYVNRPTLMPVSFTARPGTVTALVGPSGAGKSTMLATLLGFVPVQSGELRWRSAEGDYAITDLDADTMRTHIAWMPQRPVLVNSDGTTPTIEQAVRLGKSDASADDVWHALERAGVADEVRAMPQGLQTVVTPDGGGVSVGQAQRIALARALIRRAPIVLLDEPTAALDGFAEADVVRAVKDEAARGAIVIVVAHRPAMLDVADEVVRIDRDSSATEHDDRVREDVATSIQRSGW
jgi:ATP-binding cassette subfamily C protein CydCD